MNLVGLKENDRFIQAFLASEFSGRVPRSKETPTITAIGTIAESAIKSPLLTEALKGAGIEGRGFKAFSNTEDLEKDESWTLALVLSPHKRFIREICDELSPIAKRSGVVDTILRSSANNLIGVNTNAFAAAEAVRRFLGGRQVQRVLLLGTGASSRSVGIGLQKLFPETELGIMGRSGKKTQGVIDDINLGRVVKDPADFSADLVINATTVGQTDDKETLHFDLNKILNPGVYFFDLNNRTSDLQKNAKKRGCFVMPGVLMQTLTNQLRAHLLKASLTV